MDVNVKDFLDSMSLEEVKVLLFLADERVKNVAYGMDLWLETLVDNSTVPAQYLKRMRDAMKHKKMYSDYYDARLKRELTAMIVKIAGEQKGTNNG